MTETLILRDTVDGFSLVLLKKTCCRAVAYCARVAVPVSVSVPLLNEAAMPLTKLSYERISPDCAFESVIVAPEIDDALGSAITVPPSPDTGPDAIATPAPFSM